MCWWQPRLWRDPPARRGLHRHFLGRSSALVLSVDVFQEWQSRLDWGFLSSAHSFSASHSLGRLHVVLFSPVIASCCILQCHASLVSTHLPCSEAKLSEHSTAAPSLIARMRSPPNPPTCSNRAGESSHLTPPPPSSNPRDRVIMRRFLCSRAGRGTECQTPGQARL